MPKLQLRTILLVLASLAILSTSTGGYLYYTSLKRLALKEAERAAVSRATEIRKRLSSYLSDNLQITKSLARIKELQLALLSEDATNLERVHSLLSNLDSFDHAQGYDVCYLINQDGNTVASSSPNDSGDFRGTNNTLSPYFREAIQGTPAMHMSWNADQQEPDVYYSHPVHIHWNDLPIGVVVIKASIEPLQNEFSQFQKGIVLLADRRGVVFVSNRKDWLYRRLWETHANEVPEVNLRQQDNTGSRHPALLTLLDKSRALDLSGNKYMIYRMEFFNYPGWNLVYLVSNKEIFQDLLRPLLRTSGPAILFLCLFVGVSVSFLYRMAYHDIVQRKIAEDALRESEKRYRTVLEANPDPVVLCDMEGRVIYFNPAFTRVFGWSLKERFGEKMDDLVPEENWPETKMMIQKVASGESFTGIESRRYSKHGDPIAVSISGAVYWDRNGEPVGSVVNLRDISEQKKLEGQLFQAQKMEAIGTLAGGVAHDFNNLLHAIQGHAELLLNNHEQKSSYNQKLQNIFQAVKRGSELTRQLLTFSRKVESKKRPIDLNDEVVEVKKLLDHTIPKMIAIELQLADDLKVVDADPGQIERLLINLALNAKDSMPDGGKIVIKTENATLDESFCKAHIGARSGEFVLLSIMDTGHGIDRDSLKHVFEPFYSTKEVGKGTGLGLAVVYGIVKSHDGYIICDSEPGMSTVFKIYLPATCQQVEIADKEERDAPIKGGNETILLVDDEELIRGMAIDLIGRHGYTVLTAADCESALEFYRKFHDQVDLVVLDLIMPGMGGEKCLEEIVRVNPKAKVLISTGHAHHAPATNAKTTLARGYLGKPFETEQILKSIRKVLDEE